MLPVSENVLFNQLSKSKKARTAENMRSTGSNAMKAALRLRFRFARNQGTITAVRAEMMMPFTT